MSITLNESKGLRATLPHEGGEVPLGETNQGVKQWMAHKPEADFPNCFLIPIKTLNELIAPEKVDLVVAFFGIREKTFADGSSMKQMNILLAGAEQVGRKEGDFKLLGDYLAVSNPSFDPEEKNSLTKNQKRYIKRTMRKEGVSRKTTYKWAQNWAKYIHQTGLDFPKFISFTREEIADVASIAAADSVRLTLVFKPAVGEQLNENGLTLDFVYFGSRFTPHYDLSAVNVLRPGEEGGVDIGCICPGSPCCVCEICSATDYLKPIELQSPDPNPTPMTTLSQDTPMASAEKKFTSTRVPISQALEWSQNWMDHKPHINIPNSVLISRDVAEAFLNNPVLDVVVVFLGMEKIPSDSGEVLDHVRIFACGAKSNPEKPGGFSLIKGAVVLSLGYCSFDPMSKKSPHYKHITYLSHAKEGKSIDMETALKWTKNWGEYVQENKLDYPEYIIYTEEEVKDMSMVPGTDSLRLLFVYKPRKDESADNPYQLDFIFFGARMLENDEYTAATVMRPDEYYGQDHGCNCPGQPCCSCPNHRCTGYDMLKEVQ